MDECFVNKRQVREMTTLAPASIDRLERAGCFPKRIRYGGRVFWRKCEVLAWMQARIAERDSTTRLPA